MKDLSKQALRAAMRGGTESWGKVGSSMRHVRYAEPLKIKPGHRKKCSCGCGNKATHGGYANGVMLVAACELGAARWAKTGSTTALKTKGAAA